jgi:lysozyme family protein
MRYAAKWPQYAKWWDVMVIRPARVAEFERYAHFAIDHKTIYTQIGTATGLPWHMIAVLHRRESDANFNTYLGNGQSLEHKTTEVPANRGPFRGPNAFINGAVDAVHQEGWASITDWRLEKELFYCEGFNGPGYDNRGLPSPYIWGGTNIQKPGKYVSDRKWSPSAMDTQPGCAPILATIAKLDPSVRFVREAL